MKNCACSGARTVDAGAGHRSPYACNCLSSQFTWERLSGRGTVHTWTVVTHAVHPAAVERVPYVVVEVALEEQGTYTLLVI